MKAWQHLKARNDVNGNPQRLYVVYELAHDTRLMYWETVAVYDEGYGAKPEEIRDLAELPSVEITVEDFERRLAQADERGIHRYGP